MRPPHVDELGLAAGGHPEAASVEVGPGPIFGPEHFVVHGRVDNAGDGFAVALQRNGDGEVGKAVQKIRGAVQGIDDPAVGRVGAGSGALFLGEEGIAGPCFAKLGAQGFLGRGVGGADEIGVAFLQDNMMVTIESYSDLPIGIQLPDTVVLKVTEADAVVKRQTASSSYKPALLENGMRIMVPPHVEAGTRVVVNTAERSYVERAKD